ncbi:aldo/keto reductase [Actinotalea sp. K2]|uniref:aldo/keto reductase n=1 Tax=Actinotalea sp. K2 TaxID=2939438 RepID=UPI0020175ACE|nr:aldo/keto reductase [Actinotalea sp. K2]MCL3861914.1 aldo/keto reductase [Actinotalea sp. K2]
MEERLLGRTGLRVSALALGTMTWSRDTDEHEAAEQLRDFVDAGGTLLDTAASYADGEAEVLIGGLLRSTVHRDDVLLCTKAGVRQTASGGVVDASRGALLNSLDASLRRLGTDHVDLWLVQAPDQRTPLEETVGAMRHALDSGRARYVGLSNHPGWQTARAAGLLEPANRLAAVEVEYSLLQRGVEREVVPACADLGTGLLAWSPLGRGVLTGKYRRSVPADSRAASAHLAGFVEPYLGPDAAPVVEALATAAEGLGRAPLEVALAWVLGRPQVSAAVVGARTAVQLRGALGALDLRIPPTLGAALDEVSAPATGYPERR